MPELLEIIQPQLLKTRIQLDFDVGAIAYVNALLIALRRE